MSQYSIFDPPEIPPGHCKCGCGRPTNIAKRTHRPRHMIKGHAAAYLPGHNRWPPLWERLRIAIEMRGADECWPWVNGAASRGYGLITDTPTGETRAHRLVYTLVNGAIPDGMVVRHDCDDPACCNPTHLRLGAQSDNVRDMMIRGRCRDNRGLHNGRAKLDEFQVIAIRARFAKGETRQALARAYGVSWTTVHGIVTYRLWRHVRG